MILRAFPTGRNVDRVNKWTSHTQRKKSLHVPKLGPLLFLLKWKEGEDGGGGGGGGQKIGEIYIYINIKKRKGRPRWREASNARGERLVKYLRSSSKGKTVKLSSLLAFFFPFFLLGFSRPLYLRFAFPIRLISFSKTVHQNQISVPTEPYWNEHSIVISWVWYLKYYWFQALLKSIFANQINQKRL